MVEKHLSEIEFKLGFWFYERTVCFLPSTLDSFLFSDSDIRTKNVTSHRQCSLYFESATVRQTIAIQLWRDYLCHRTHLFPVINLKIQGSSHFFPFGFPFFLISFFRKEFLKDGISEFYFSLFSVSGVLMVPAVCLHSSAFHHPSALFKRRTFSLISFAFSKTGYSIE